MLLQTYDALMSLNRSPIPSLEHEFHQDMGAYYIFSGLAMLLYWALLVDFAEPWLAIAINLTEQIPNWNCRSLTKLFSWKPPVRRLAIGRPSLAGASPA